MLASSRSDECRYPTDKVVAAALVVDTTWTGSGGTQRQEAWRAVKKKEFPLDQLGLDLQHLNW